MATRAHVEALADTLGTVKQGTRAQASRNSIRAVSVFGVTAETYPVVQQTAELWAQSTSCGVTVYPLGATGIVIIKVR